MWSHRRLGIVGAVIAFGLALGVQPAQTQKRGEGRIVERYQAGQVEAAPAWVQTAAAKTRLRYNQRLGAGQSELALKEAVLDDLNLRHLRFDQRYNGVPVVGGELVVQEDGSGNTLGDFGTVFDNIGISTAPALDAQKAIAAARNDLAYKGSLAGLPTAKLVVLPTDTGYVLAYQVTLKIEDGTEATAHHEYFVNAQDGSIALHYDSLPHEDTHAPRASNATGSGRSLYSGTVSLTTDLVSGTYYLRDNTRGGMYATDMRNRTNGSGTTYTDSDNVWGTGTTSSSQSAAVDAQFGAGLTWDYYLNTFGRRGIDGNGYRVLSRVHYGRNYNNAFWNGSNMTYGDGDGSTFRPLVSLDVVGHEITHGLTERTANLAYQKESGASNESFSDIFGTMIEYSAGNIGGRTPDYFIGEDIQIQADAAPGFRNMADPTEDGDPDNYANRVYPGSCSPSSNNDNCGVHTNSSIQNHAFYLLAEGGTNRTSGLSVTGIGRAKAAAVFYRALTVKLTSNATFSAVRAGTLSAASDLYGSGSAEYNSVAKAWTAVGVQ